MLDRRIPVHRCQRFQVGIALGHEPAVVVDRAAQRIFRERGASVRVTPRRPGDRFRCECVGQVNARQEIIRIPAPRAGSCRDDRSGRLDHIALRLEFRVLIACSGHETQPILGHPAQRVECRHIFVRGPVRTETRDDIARGDVGTLVVDKRGRKFRRTEARSRQVSIICRRLLLCERLKRVARWRGIVDLLDLLLLLLRPKLGAHLHGGRQRTRQRKTVARVSAHIKFFLVARRRRAAQPVEFIERRRIADRCARRLGHQRIVDAVRKRVGPVRAARRLAEDRDILRPALGAFTVSGPTVKLPGAARHFAPAAHRVNFLLLRPHAELFRLTAHPRHRGARRRQRRQRAFRKRNRRDLPDLRIRETRIQSAHKER